MNYGVCVCVCVCVNTTVYVCWGGFSTRGFKDGMDQQHWVDGNRRRLGGEKKQMHKHALSSTHTHTDTHSWWAVSHLVRCLALEAANIQWSDEGHILKAVLHAHRFGAFVLKITPEFHHLRLYIFLYFPRGCSWMKKGRLKERQLPLSVSGQWKLMDVVYLEGEHIIT